MGRYDYPENNKIGIPLTNLIDELHECEPHEIKNPPIFNIQERLSQEPMKSAIERRYKDDFVWEKNWRHLPYQVFENFTTDEAQRLLWSSCIMSDLDEMMRQNPRYRIFAKVSNCLWRWGWRNDYNLFVRSYNAIRSFNFNVNGFTVYLDHTTYCNDRGYSQYARKYLDGVFAYNIHYKNTHVMTIGFSVSKYGLLISQVQLTEPKGNRWLYKLPCHYVEHAVNQLAAAFNGWRLLFVDGNQLAQNIQSSYGKNSQLFTLQMTQHVVKVYSKRFQYYKRAGYRQINNFRFHYLHPKVA